LITVYVLKLDALPGMFCVLMLQVLTMFLPLILLMILPKLINTQDPEMQRVCGNVVLILERLL